jgi:glycerol dehydrogenase-like iron-containing ADH family enzyme
VQGSLLATTARQQLLKFYGEIGLPQSLADLGLLNITLAELQQAAEIACRPGSDIHHLPFEITPTQLMAAMVSTTAPRAGSGVPNAVSSAVSSAVSGLDSREG